MTREIERLYQAHGLITGDGPGGLSLAPEDFDAAINAPIQILSHIAANWFSNRHDRQAFLRDVTKSLERVTKQRVSGQSTQH